MNEAMATDAELREKVYQTLKNEGFIYGGNIEVRVMNRTVYVEGMVNSERERDMAYEAVVNIFGVRNVVNYLTYPCPYLARNIS